MEIAKCTKFQKVHPKNEVGKKIQMLTKGFLEFSSITPSV